jgi:hypothetical protein
MLKDELGAIVNALNQVEQSASFGEKYGPYFFAVALIIIVPFISRAVFAGSLASADATVRKRALEDFRFYFRLTAVTGVLCVVAGVGWWIFENFRESARTQAKVAELTVQLQKLDTLIKGMNFASYGVISAGIKPEDIFYATLVNPQMSVYFAKLPAAVINSEASWFFVVLSNQELPKTLEINVGWSQRASSGDAGAILNMPTRLMLGKNNAQYKFSLEQDAANIRPIAN